MKNFKLEPDTQELISSILDEMEVLIEDIRKSMTKENGLRMASQVHTLHWHIDGLMEGVKQSLHGDEAQIPGLPPGIQGIPIPAELIERLAPELAKMGRNGSAPTTEGEAGPGGQYL